MNKREIASHASELHRKAIVIDGHSDILMGVADGIVRLGEDFQLPDPMTWKAPIRSESIMQEFNPLLPHALYFGSAGLYSVPQLMRGGVTVLACAIYIEDRQLDLALQRGLQMTRCLHYEVDTNPNFKFVKNVDDILVIKREGKCGAILSFEGFEPLGADLGMLDLYYQLGLRMASLTHNRRNYYADGVQPGIQTGGLTTLGKQAIRRMNELGIVIDLVHLNEIGFWEVLELAQAPVVVSHTSPYSFARPGNETPPRPGFDLPHDRAKLEALARNGGVLGVIFFGQENLEKIVDDIELLMDVVGPDHIGLGSDLFGQQFSPVGLEDISKTPAITRELVKRGYSDEVILKILGGNFLRVYTQVWK
jgi:membrane dipeptidase